MLHHTSGISCFVVACDRNEFDSLMSLISPDVLANVPKIVYDEYQTFSKHHLMFDY